MTQRGLSVNTGRLFLALWPDRAVRAAILSWQAMHAWSPSARLTAPQDLHLTLHFIGAVPSERLPEIVAGLTVPSPEVVFDIDQAVLWPRGLAVLMPSRIPDELLVLHAGLVNALRRLNLPVDERAYQPHVTLARRAEKTALPTEQLAPVRWRARDYVLAVRAGEHYAVLHRYAGAQEPA